MAASPLGGAFVGMRSLGAVDSAMNRSYAWFMQIQLSPEQRSFIELGIQQGRFRDPGEAMQQALSLWTERERVRLELLAEIEAGDNSPRENDAILDSDEEIADFLAGVEQQGSNKLRHEIAH